MQVPREPDAAGSHRTSFKKNASAWLIILILIAQSAVIFRLRDPLQYIWILPVFCADILLTSVPLRAFLKALKGLLFGSAVFSLAALIANQNGRELVAGLIYSEGLTEAILLLLRFTFLGLASQASLHRFGQSTVLRALAILLAPLRVFGVSGTAAARVLYRTLGLMPLILPRLTEMLKKRRLDILDLARLHGTKTRLGVPARRNTARLFAQTGFCLFWMGCALFLFLCPAH
ncbi:MAG: hypothetical protein LBC99_04350 [Spirochaetota bacterium]|jgi:energy-coupling factor transporter transmembrane protein EcfT|nr:hypothetical protein [Spirochaetota bacterium]